MKELTKFNINSYILVKLSDLGIIHYVQKYNNNDIPLWNQISCSEMTSRRNADGYHKFQFHEFLDMFGDLGMSASDYFETTVLFRSEDLEELKVRL